MHFPWAADRLAEYALRALSVAFGRDDRSNFACHVHQFETVIRPNLLTI